MIYLKIAGNLVQQKNTKRYRSIGNINYKDKLAKIGQDFSLRTADVSPRSSPLRDFSPRETSFSGHERGETSAICRLARFFLMM